MPLGSIDIAVIQRVWDRGARCQTCNFCLIDADYEVGEERHYCGVLDDTTSDAVHADMCPGWFKELERMNAELSQDAADTMQAMLEAEESRTRGNYNDEY